MSSDDKGEDRAGNRKLDRELRRALKEVEREPVPGRLLRLARRLAQAIAAARRGRDG